MQVRHGKKIVMKSAEELCYFWKRVKEVTAFSYSSIHYGHYKPAAHSERLSYFLSQKITLIARTGYLPDIWSYGHTIML